MSEYHAITPGSFLKQIRELNRQTIGDIATKLKTTNSTVGKLEKDRISLASIDFLTLCETYRITDSGREKLKELISDPAWNRHLQNEKGRKKEEREIREKREQEARYIGMILSLPKESVMRIVKTVLSHYAEEEKETTKS